MIKMSFQWVVKSNYSYLFNNKGELIPSDTLFELLHNGSSFKDIWPQYERENRIKKILADEHSSAFLMPKNKNE